MFEIISILLAKIVPITGIAKWNDGNNFLMLSPNEQI